MKIEVTQADIDRGESNHCCNCPIAIAMTSTTKRGCIVWRTEALIGRRRVVLPLIAREFIADFDDGKPVEPFSFEVEV